MIPGGSVALISGSRAATALATSRLFSPTRISTVPSTTSRPFWVAAPMRSSEPVDTPARSSTRTGAPPTLRTTSCRRSVERRVTAAELPGNAQQHLLAVALDVRGAPIGIVAFERHPTSSASVTP